MRKGLRRGSLSCVADVLRWDRGPAEREGGARAHGDPARHDHRLNMHEKVYVVYQTHAVTFVVSTTLCALTFQLLHSACGNRDHLAVGDGGHTASPINSTTSVARDRMRVCAFDYRT